MLAYFRIVAEPLIVDFEIEPGDRAELDRLVAQFGGDRQTFLREAMRVMAAQERAGLQRPS